jgi:NAD(P)-dependent dehydrogenase (short-subunit alcohol dehydrogenase family)
MRANITSKLSPSAHVHEAAKASWRIELRCLLSGPQRFQRERNPMTPQDPSAIHRLVGWLVLTLDTLFQRLINWNASQAHPIFASSHHASGLTGPLIGKTAIVTGANTGLGLETARWLASAGATVVLACRSPIKAEAAVANIRHSCPDASIESGVLDLADFASVRTFAATFMHGSLRDDVCGPSAARPLHILVLNAGVMCVPQADPETHFTVNHLAHALLTLLLLPALSVAAPVHARIVAVSSISCMVSDLDLDDIGYKRRPYRSFEAYANSKLCNLLFLRALADRLDGSGIRCAGVHPGESPTDVSRHLGKVWSALHHTFGPLFLLSARESSRTAVYAALASNPWDRGEEARVWRGEALLHAANRVRPVPSRFFERSNPERLWAITLASVCLSPAEQKILTALGLRLESQLNASGVNALKQM